MIDIINQSGTTKNGKKIVIERAKWSQGRMFDWLVEIYEDNEKIFSESDMNAGESKKLYREKVKEYGGI